MRPEIPRRLSDFEAIIHRKLKKTTLSSEIEDCFDYFDDHSPKELGDHKTVEIHGIGITLRRVNEGKGFSIETDGVTQIVGKDKISIVEQNKIARKIWKITMPYARYHAEKFKSKRRAK